MACRTSQSTLGVELDHDSTTSNPEPPSKASRSAADQYWNQRGAPYRSVSHSAPAPDFTAT